jgi:hypothetical protein
MPNPFIPLPVLLQKLDALRNEVLAQNLPEKQRSLHGRGQQQDLEGWQAFVFAVAYSRCFKLSEMCVQLAEEQYSAHDATLRWVKGEQQQFLKIQLKGLVPEYINPRANLQDLVTEKLNDSAPSKDVVFVFFLERGSHTPTVTIPDHQKGGVWILGFSKADHSEVFLVGADSRYSHRGVVHYGTPASRPAEK